VKVRKQLYYDTVEDVKVTELINRLEEIGEGKAGYVNAKLKECLGVYQALAKRSGLEEPLDVLMFYIDNSNAIQPSNIPAQPQEQRVNNEAVTVSDEVDDSVADLISDGGFDF
jgi:hypothetical protein